MQVINWTVFCCGVVNLYCVHYFMGINALYFGRRLLNFQKNLSPPYSELKSKPRKQVACITYYSTLQMETIPSFET
jgi:hypothetical protein